MFQSFYVSGLGKKLMGGRFEVLYDVTFQSFYVSGLGKKSRIRIHALGARAVSILLCQWIR